MKQYLKLLFILTLIMTTSCSKDEISENEDLLGVWEKTDFEGDLINTYRLVFGSDFTGLKINTSTSTNGEVISTSSDYQWRVTGNMVILIENDNTEEVYIINSEGKLVSSISEDVTLDKISDDYSQYYSQ